MRPAGRWHVGCASATAMTDLLFIAAIIAFFAIGALYTRFCGSL